MRAARPSRKAPKSLSVWPHALSALPLPTSAPAALSAGSASASSVRLLITRSYTSAHRPACVCKPCFSGARFDVAPGRQRLGAKKPAVAARPHLSILTLYRPALALAPLCQPSAPLSALAAPLNAEVAAMRRVKGAAFAQAPRRCIKTGRAPPGLCCRCLRAPR